MSWCIDRWLACKLARWKTSEFFVNMKSPHCRMYTESFSAISSATTCIVKSDNVHYQCHFVKIISMNSLFTLIFSPQKVILQYEFHWDKQTHYRFFSCKWHTVNVERFTGLNIHSFSPMKFFAGILLWCLGQLHLLLFNYSKVFTGKRLQDCCKNPKTMKI